MSIQGVSRKTENCLAILGKQDWLSSFYLAGGTGCALQLGHRLSYDLDFFISTDFDTSKIRADMEKAGKFSLEQNSPNTLLGEFNNVKISFFTYKYPLMFSIKEFTGVKIADLVDIGCMKLDAIGSRGIKRDFIDLYFICKDKANMLCDLIRYYSRKYNIKNTVHIIKSLTYFEDAEDQAMPKMLKPCNWNDVKRFFEKEVIKLVNR